VQASRRSPFLAGTPSVRGVRPSIALPRPAPVGSTIVPGNRLARRGV